MFWSAIGVFEGRAGSRGTACMRWMLLMSPPGW